MTCEDLDRIDEALLEVVVTPRDSARARGVVVRFNAQVDEARARVTSARAAHSLTGSISGELQTELRGYAVMFVEERERIVRQWGIAPPHHH